MAAFGFPLFAPAMFDALGYGKGCTLLAGVSIVLGCPAYAYLFITPDVRFVDAVYVGRPWIFWKYGKRIRMSSTYARKEEILR